MIAIASAGATSKQNPKPRANTTAARVPVSEEPDGAATRSRPTGAHGIAAPAPSQCCFPTPKANADPCGCAAPAAAVHDGGCKGSQANGKSQGPTGTTGNAASATGQRRNSKPHAATPGLEASPVPSDCNEHPQEKNPSFGKAMRQLGASRMQLNPRQRLLAKRRRWLLRLRKALCARTKNAMPKPRRRAPRGIFAFAHNTKAPLDRGGGGRNPTP